MEAKKPFLVWINENRHVCVEVLRIYLGLGLFLKGIFFLVEEQQLSFYISQDGLPALPYAAVHYIVIAHIGGGLMMMVGLLTRIAALAQIPIVCGAFLLVNQTYNLFAPEQTLEFILLVLFLLIFFVIYGSGGFSVDHAIAKRFNLHKR